MQIQDLPSAIEKGNAAFGSAVAVVENSGSKVAIKNDLIRLCAWCGANMGTKPGGNGITHGLCDSCLKAEMAKPVKTPVALGNDAYGSGIKTGDPVEVFGKEGAVTACHADGSYSVRFSYGVIDGIGAGEILPLRK